MEKYDPAKVVDPIQWNLLDEGERLLLVEDYHKNSDQECGDISLHCIFHCIIENQIAMGDQMPVSSVLSKLIEEGLDRHEAIHAIASVLAEQLHDQMSPSGKKDKFDNDLYCSNLQKLSAESWKNSA